MDFVELGYDYSLGVAELDRQHKELERQLNEAIKHCTGKKADEKIFYDSTRQSSIAFLKNHFKTEEKLLRKTAYDHLGTHKAAHKEMLRKLQKMHEDIVRNRVELDLFYITACIKEMVTKHIRTFDLNAKNYFIEGHEKTTA